MKRQFRYIISSFIILSLIGLGTGKAISLPNVKYYKETELVSKATSAAKESKCHYYSQYLDVTVDELITKLWSDKYILYYNHKISVQLISLKKLFSEREPIFRLFNKNYTPRNSTENHPISL